MKGSSPGEDGIQLMFICGECDELRMKVIEMMKRIFEKGAGRD